MTVVLQWEPVSMQPWCHCVDVPLDFRVFWNMFLRRGDSRGVKLADGIRSGLELLWDLLIAIAILSPEAGLWPIRVCHSPSAKALASLGTRRGGRLRQADQR